MCEKKYVRTKLEIYSHILSLGELQEQLVKMPNYIAHIKSFDLRDLSYLCSCIQTEPDLEGISYLWVDAISVDQYYNDERKKETIL